MDFLSPGFFARALDLLFPPRDGEHLARAARPEDMRAQFAPMRTDKSTPHAVALAQFRTPLMRGLVHEAKYRGNTRAQELLAVLLADYLEAWLEEERAADAARAANVGYAASGIALVPIPLSRSRQRERGFNQSEAIARKALHQLDAAARDAIALSPLILSRVRDTEHQTTLSRAGRRANVLGAFRVNGAIDPSRTYIVFDDVLTTGATLQAAIDALAAAGAIRIVPITLAH